MECQYCKNIFKTKSNLLKHQKYTKYCLELQGKEINKRYLCTGCEVFYSSNENLIGHYPKCVEYQIELTKRDYKKDGDHFYEKIEMLENTIKEKDNQIRQLQDKLENIALKAVSQPKTVNNSTTRNTHINVVNNLIPIEENYFKEQSAFLTIEHIKKGLTGYVEYAMDYPFKDRIVCVDYARRKIKFKNANGAIITDPEMIKLAPLFFDSIKEKSREIVNEWGRQHTFSSDVFPKIVEALDVTINIQHGSEGHTTDFYYDFVKNVCGETIVDE